MSVLELSLLELSLQGSPDFLSPADLFVCGLIDAARDATNNAVRQHNAPRLIATWFSSDGLSVSIRLTDLELKAVVKKPPNASRPAFCEFVNLPLFGRALK